MSRVGKQPVVIPAGVTVRVDASGIEVQGPKGRLVEKVPPHVSITVQGGEVRVERAGDNPEQRACHGLARALIRNMVAGVKDGFHKDLEIIGVGFRAEVKGKKLVMALGYSHPIEFDIPEGISITVEKNVNLTVRGSDKKLVGQVCANIRAFRSPDHYKGKGIRYKGESVRIKQGKSA